MSDKKKKKPQATPEERRKNRQELAKLIEKNDLILTAKYRQEQRYAELKQLRSQVDLTLQEASEIITERQKRIKSLVNSINSEVDRMIDYLDKAENQFLAMGNQNMPEIPIDLDERKKKIIGEFEEIYDKFMKEFDFGAFAVDDDQIKMEEKESSPIPLLHSATYMGFDRSKTPLHEELSKENNTSTTTTPPNDHKLSLLRQEIVLLEEQLEKLEIRELADAKIQQRRIDEMEAKVCKLRAEFLDRVGCSSQMGNQRKVGGRSEKGVDLLEKRMLKKTEDLTGEN